MRTAAHGRSRAWMTFKQAIELGGCVRKGEKGSPVVYANTLLRTETDPETGEPSPYVLVRGQLEAKLARSVFYELANMAEPAPDGSDMLGVWSQGVFFPLGPAA